MTAEKLLKICIVLHKIPQSFSLHCFLVYLSHIIIIPQNIYTFISVFKGCLNISGILVRKFFDARKRWGIIFRHDIVDVNNIVSLTGHSCVRFHILGIHVLLWRILVRALCGFLCKLCGKLFRRACLALCDRFCGCFIYHIDRAVHRINRRLCGRFGFFWCR